MRLRSVSRPRLLAAVAALLLAACTQQASPTPSPTPPPVAQPSPTPAPTAAPTPVVASGAATATIGTSVVWGAFEIPVSLPAGTRGPIALEVFQLSARDGSEIDLVRIPLELR